MTTIDLDFRPDTYWPESLTPEQLLLRIRGKVRQDMARKIYREQGFQGLNEFLVRERLSEDDRTAWGRIHPDMMGGEYLPELEPGEVEITRISMQSTTSDQISVRARQEDGKIRYRVVGEYEDDESMHYGLPFDESEQPLTLQELVQLIDGSRIDGDIYPGGILNSNWAMVLEHGDDEEEIAEFLSLSSAFYPQLARYYDLLVEAWLEEHRDPEEECCD